MVVSPLVAFIVLALLISETIGLVGVLVILQIKDRKHAKESQNAQSPKIPQTKKDYLPTSRDLKEKGRGTRL